jgi:hypothetical protein
MGDAVREVWSEDDWRPPPGSRGHLSRWGYLWALVFVLCLLGIFIVAVAAGVEPDECGEASSDQPFGCDWSYGRAIASAVILSAGAVVAGVLTYRSYRRH